MPQISGSAARAAPCAWARRTVRSDLRKVCLKEKSSLSKVYGEFWLEKPYSPTVQAQENIADRDCRRVRKPQEFRFSHLAVYDCGSKKSTSGGVFLGMKKNTPKTPVLSL